MYRDLIPPVLAHFHIRKTGGSTLNSMIQHNFAPSEIAHLATGYRPKYDSWSREICHPHLLGHPKLGQIRYITGHLPYINDIFPTVRYVTVIRNPIDRVISEYYFARQEGQPVPPTLDEYVEVWNPYLDNYQVRVLSGTKDLRIKHHHCEMAMIHLAEDFLVAAPLEKMTELALILAMIYGWPLRRLLNEYKNKTTLREEPSPEVRKKIANWNVYDYILWELLGERFAHQRLMFEPTLTRNLLAYRTLNTALNLAGRVLPWSARKSLAHRFLYR